MRAHDLKSAMEKDEKAYLILDVRETDEVEEEPYFESATARCINIPLSVLGMIPKDEITDRLVAGAQGLGKALDDVQVVVGCRSGGRSAVAVKLLASLDIEAENLEGGRIAWGESL